MRVCPVSGLISGPRNPAPLSSHFTTLACGTPRQPRGVARNRSVMSYDPNTGAPYVSQSSTRAEISSVSPQTTAIEPHRKIPRALIVLLTLVRTENTRTPAELRHG